jgi:hypothetical protein
VSADILISRVLPQKTKNCNTIYFDLRLNHRYYRDTKRLFDKFGYHTEIVEVSRLYDKIVKDEIVWKQRVKCIYTEEVLHFGGWLFKKHFYNTSTVHYAVTKQHMMKLFHQFLDMHDEMSSLIYQECLNTFEDGMIFEMSF